MVEMDYQITSWPLDRIPLKYNYKDGPKLHYDIHPLQ